MRLTEASIDPVTRRAIPTLSRRDFCAALIGAGATLGLRAAETGATAARPIGPLADSPARLVPLDPRFHRLVAPTARISRLQTGSRWSEGPAWSPDGRFLVWSDVPNSRQWRWREDDGEVSLFREPSHQTNGCAFDPAGRMYTCEQVGHRVVRHERDGFETVLASSVDGIRFNSPNDVAVHPDGGVWFTDPGYGGPRPLPQREATYRIDPATGAVERVEMTLAKPNGLCFSPDFSRLYVADTGMPPPRALWLFDVVVGRRLENKRVFATLEHAGMVAGPDGQQADVHGNLWSSAGGGPDGVNGVHVFAPDGTRLGLIILPETCANVCFGGGDRTRLFMTATTSLYAIETNVAGAHLA